MVPFKELAVIVATGRDNSILCYPAVETIHRDNICHIVKASANESRKIMKLETDIYSRPFSSSEGIGVFTVEIFLTGDGELCFMGHHPLIYESKGRWSHDCCWTFDGHCGSTSEIISERRKCRGYPGCVELPKAVLLTLDMPEKKKEFKGSPVKSIFSASVDDINLPKTSFMNVPKIILSRCLCFCPRMNIELDICVLG
nr:phosphoribosylaminoimidazole carboxylase [Tanacetum cinerariifolium]